MMAFRLTKSEAEEKAALEARLVEVRHDLQETYKIVNADIEVLNEKLEKCHSLYNDVLTDAYDFVQRIAEDKQEEFDEKSESWQEGDRGEAVSEWISEFSDNLSGFEEYEFQSISELEDLDLDQAETLAGIPSAPEE